MLKLSRREAQIEMASRYLWDYCRLTDPKNYNKKRPFLVELCNTIESFLEDELINESTKKPYRKLMINMPPRHLKTYTLINAITWWVGRNPEKQVISLSYNDTLATRFSSAIRDKIDTEVAGEQDQLYFQDIFASRLKYGDSAKKVWAMEGSHHTYLGGSLKSTVTGMGCHVGIIDDPIKNDIDALNDVFLEELHFHYQNTFLSRIEKGGKQIINMTRWSKNDLCGKLLETDSDSWYVLKMRAVADYDEERMLCDDILPFDEFIDKTKGMDDSIVAANYQQAPIEIKGLLYKRLMTYKPDELPEGVVRSYTDVADDGSDYLCSIVYVEHDQTAYVIDLMFTNKSSQDTEPKCAKMLEVNGVNEAMFESNNGGKAYARFVSSHLSTNFTTIRWFHQTDNKQARLLSYAPWIQQNVYFPENWAQRWPTFFKHLRTFKKIMKSNKFDDAPDALTGVAEMVCDHKKFDKSESVSGQSSKVVIL